MPEEKSYKVTGPRPIMGVQPGDTLTASLDEKHEARLIKRGDIEPSGGAQKIAEKSSRASKPSTTSSSSSSSSPSASSDDK